MLKGEVDKFRWEFRIAFNFLNEKLDLVGKQFSLIQCVNDVVISLWFVLIRTITLSI